MKKAINKVENYLSKTYNFRYNVISNSIEFKLLLGTRYKALDDYDLNTIIRELRSVNIGCHKIDLLVTLNSNFVEKYNPFREYFGSLPVWNETMPDYINQLAETITLEDADKDIWKTYLKKWIVAALACAVKDSAVNQQVLVLIGSQGIGKTTWMEKLVPQLLKTYYYSGSINPNDKDCKTNLGETLFMNLDELENLNRTELGNLKQFITQSTIRIRKPYALNHITIPRRASLMGSVNNPTFLRDNTGNRRFLCMECKSINYKHEIDINLVYSQALHLYNTGFKYWFSDDDINIINTHNLKYKFTPIELDIVNEFFEPCKTNEEADYLMNISELHKYLSDKGENPGAVNKLGSVMLASEYTRTKQHGRWLYRLKKRIKE